MIDLDFDTNDFDNFDAQSHDMTLDSTSGLDFPTTDSTDLSFGVGGTGTEYPDPDPLPTSSHGQGLDELGAHQPSFGGRNHESESGTVQPLEFRPDNNGHNDDYHSALQQNESDQHSEVSFKGTPQEKAEWAKKAQSEKEWVDFYNRQADSCLIRGDVNGYKQHLADAKRHAEYYDKFIANSKK